MTALPVKRHFTAEEFLALPDAEGYELVDGTLVERKTMGAPESRVAVRIGYKFEAYCDANPDAGWVLESETAYQCFPSADTLRRPDVSFIRSEHYPEGKLPKGSLRVPPDLCVEVISPTNTAGAVEVKVQLYLSAGVQLVWVVFPETRSVHARRPDGSATIYNEQQDITAEGILPGFMCPVREFFVRM